MPSLNKAGWKCGVPIPSSLRSCRQPYACVFVSPSRVIAASLSVDGRNPFPRRRGGGWRLRGVMSYQRLSRSVAKRGAHGLGLLVNRPGELRAALGHNQHITRQIPLLNVDPELESLRQQSLEHLRHLPWIPSARDCSNDIVGWIVDLFRAGDLPLQSRGTQKSRPARPLLPFARTGQQRTGEGRPHTCRDLAPHPAILACPCWSKYCKCGSIGYDPWQ